MSEVETEVSISEFIKLASTRADSSLEGGKGKPCGASHIPKAHNCTKNTASTTKSKLETAAKVALATGVLAGGAYLFKKKYFTKEEWDKHPANKLRNPKLTEAEAKRIADEAIAGGKKWDAQEQINQRRRQSECGGDLGKIQAPGKFDADTDWYGLSTGAMHARALVSTGSRGAASTGGYVNKPRCQAGAGAFGTYFVHPSEQYGIKLFRNGDEDDVASEFRRLDKADYAGVNVPTPLRMQAVRDVDGEIRSQTLILTHMKGYRTLGREYRDSYGNASNAPLIVKTKIAREFRKLHTAGLAHGDIHNGNLMVNPISKRVALIDFGYATELHDGRQPAHYRNGVQNLLYDMNRLPEFLGFSSRGQDFLERYKGVLSNVHDQAKELATYGGVGNEERFQIAVKRFHDALETELLWDDRMPRSRFVSGADQPRIPGLTRRLLTANLSSGRRAAMESFAGKRDLRVFNEQAKKLGVKPPRLFLALKPERDARLARERQQPFGTPIRGTNFPSKPPLTSRRGQRPFTVNEWED